MIAKSAGFYKHNTVISMSSGAINAEKANAKFQNPAGFKQVAAEFERSNYAISADLPEMADPKSLTAKMGIRNDALHAC